MFTLGLYSAAVSISQDTSLRKTIKKSIPELFDNIGAAQIEKVLKERVMKLVRANQERMEEETGGISHSLTEEELKDYMQEVIQEKRSKDNILHIISLIMNEVITIFNITDLPQLFPKKSIIVLD